MIARASSAKRGQIAALVPLWIEMTSSAARSETPDVRFLGIDLDLLTPAERRDLANALLRAAWSAALEDTRILLLDLLLEVDEAALGGTA